MTHDESKQAVEPIDTALEGILKMYPHWQLVDALKHFLDGSQKKELIIMLLKGDKPGHYNPKTIPGPTGSLAGYESFPKIQYTRNKPTDDTLCPNCGSTLVSYTDMGVLQCVNPDCENKHEGVNTKTIPDTLPNRPPSTTMRAIPTLDNIIKRTKLDNDIMSCKYCTYYNKTTHVLHYYLCPTHIKKSKE